MAAGFLILVARGGAAMGSDWPSWRGPQANGIVSGANLPLHWSTNQNILWRVEIPGAGWSQPVGWGSASSPVLYGNLLYVQCDNDKESFLLALERKTGKQSWSVARNEKSNWSSPYIWKNRVRTELVSGGGTMVRSYKPENGGLLCYEHAYW